jgi:hypothetical protein
MLEMILEASGLQIECGLFLWLSSDVGKLLKVMDVSCMGCGELVPNNGERHHWRPRSSMGRAMELGRMGKKTWGLLTMTWGSSSYSSSDLGRSRWEIGLRHHGSLRWKMMGLGTISSNSGEVEGM